MSGTEFREDTLNAAGRCAGELRRAGNPTEAQMSLALLSAYLCSQYQIEPGLFAQVLLSNMLQVGRDEQLMPRVIERIHNISTRVKPTLAVVGSEGTSDKVGDKLRHGIHPRTGVKM